MFGRPRHLLLVATLIALSAILSACVLPATPALREPSADAVDGETSPPAPNAPEGFVVTPVADGLVGPTQMIAGPDGRIWVAQLNGPENGGAGQVLALDLASGESTVLVDGLLKPTGIAVVDGALWIATRRDLLRAPLSAGATMIEVGAPVTILSDLPFNGRSNGTLTVTQQGTLLYETSGSQSGGRVAEGSGRLWELDPATWQAPAPRPVAQGLKGAYAHAIDAAGNLWIGEIGDDPVNGGPPPDELNVLPAAAWALSAGGDVPDFGWPHCFGDREPATNLSGTVEECAITLPPVALFPPRSTPVSVAVAPWDPATMLVALWVSNEVRAVAASPETVAGSAAGALTPVTGEPFLTGVTGPQSLLALDDGTLLVIEFSTGAIYRVAQEFASN